MQLKITLLQSVQDTAVNDSAEFADLESLHDHFPHIEGPKGALFNSVESWIDLYGSRKNDNVALLTPLFMCDADAITPQQFDTLCDVLDPVDVWVYSSPGHGIKETDGTYRVRAVVALDRAYTRTEFYPVFDAINMRLGGLLDIATRKPSQPYYLPTHLAHAPDHFSIYSPGVPWCVDDLIKEAPGPIAAAPAAAPLNVSRAEIADLAATLRNKRSPSMRQQGIQLQHILAGEPFAEDGERDISIFKIANRLVEEWPDLQPDAMAELFGASLERMPGAEPMYVADVAAKLERRQSELRATKKEAEAKRRSERQERIRASFGDKRDHEATPDEMEALRDRYGDVRLRRLYIVGRDRFHYILRPDATYTGPYGDGDLVIAAHRDLAVFPNTDTDYQLASGEWRRKSAQRLREDYSDVMGEVVYDLTAQRTEYCADKKLMTVAPCPFVVQPVYHQDVQEWLYALGGEKAIDVAATMLRLHEISGAPVFVGPGGTGKTLFAVLAARALGGPPSPIKELSDRFNELLARMPIILADESPGPEYKKRGSTFLRDMLARTVHYVEPKYKPKGKLYGALRLVFTANNMNVLETTEDLSQMDMSALAERLIYMPVQKEARKYLEGKITRAKIQQEWIREGRGGEHFLWLAQNWEIRKQGARFLVQGEQSALHDSMVGGMGLAGEVIDWLLNYLTDPQTLDLQRHYGVRIHEGELYATSRAIAEHWETYAQTRTASQVRIGRSLASVAYEGRVQMYASGKQINYYRLRLDIMRAALVRHQLTTESFDAALSLDTDGAG